MEDFFAGTVSKTKSLEETKAYVSEIAENQISRLYFVYVVIDKKEGCIAAFVDIKNIDWNLPKSEMGCFVDADYANKKVSSNALKLVIEHLFDTFPFEKLFLRTHEENGAAITFTAKCGFEKEGLLRKDYRTTSGKLVNLLYFGLLWP